MSFITVFYQDVFRCVHKNKTTTAWCQNKSLFCDWINVFNTNLHSWGANHIEGTDHAVDEVHDFGEALLANTPGAVDEEHYICFGTFAHWGKENKSIWSF